MFYKITFLFLFLFLFNPISTTIMNIIKIKKLQAQKIYDKAQFLIYTLTVYSFTALICCFLCSYPLWFPSMRHFLYVYLPNVFSLFINPKCLFIVGNIIIVLLVRESKVSGSICSPAIEISNNYHGHGYVEISTRNSVTRCSILEDDKMEEKELMKQILIDQERENRSDVREDEDKKGKTKENVLEQEVVHDQVEEERGDHDEGEEEQPAHEELTRRVEDFIARVNRQRWIEANLVDKFSH